MDIALQTTPLSDDGVAELAQEIDALPQAGVFLAGLESGPQFAPKVEVAEGQRVEYIRVDAGSGEPEYRAVAYVKQVVKRQDSGTMQTVAVTIGEKINNKIIPTEQEPAEVVAQEWIYLEGLDQNLYPVELHENGIGTKVAEYAQKKRLQENDVRSELTVEVKQDIYGNSYMMACHNETPLRITQMTENGVVWVDATPRNVLEKAGVLTGNSAAGSDADWNTPAYQNTQGQNFGVLKAVGFSPKDLIKWPFMPKSWVEVAKNKRMQLYLGAIVNHNEQPDEWKKSRPTKDKVGDDITARSMKLLQYIKDSGQPGILDVASEATWWYQGDHGWEDTRKDRPNRYHDAYGENIIAEAYVRAHQAAQALGLEVGKDVILMYNGYGALVAKNSNLPSLNQQPADMADFTAQVLIKTKTEIARRLGIPVNEVQIAVGDEGHIYTDPKNPDWIGGNYVADVTKERIQNAIHKLSQLGLFCLTELQINYSKDIQQIHDTVLTVLEAALSTGKVKLINLYEALRFVNLWHAQNVGLFEKDSSGQYQETEFFYDVMRTIKTATPALN